MPCEGLKNMSVMGCLPFQFHCFVVFITKNEFCNANKLIGFEMYCLKNSKYKTALLKL